MQAKRNLSAAVLGALLSAGVPAITHAESQQEWLLRQLQITDGYTPERPTAPPKKTDGNASRTDTKAAKGSEGGTGYVGASQEGSGGSAYVGNPKKYNYLDDPSYRAYLRWNGFPDPRPATPSRTNNEAQTKAGNTQMSAEDKSGTQKSE
jgi:hypothetical protein